MSRNFLLFVLLLFMPATVRAFPHATGNGEGPECREALALAKATYRSDNFSLSDLVPPKGWSAHLLLGWDGQNNGNIQHDKTAIAERPENPTIYWQLRPTGGKRFIGVDIWPDWKGDYFNILLVDAALSEAQVRSAQEAGTLDSPLDDNDQVLFQDSSGTYGLITLPAGYGVGTRRIVAASEKLEPRRA